MLTLILQTQEGHQIELNVQPEDTFADLKSQNSEAADLGLSDSLQQLITNGASVAENTKIFDYVTSSANEWFSTGQICEPDVLQPTEIETQSKECCVLRCSSSEVSTAGKQFYPLSTDHNSLSECLIEIGRPDLYNNVLETDTETSQKYSLSPQCTVEQTASLSLLKPKNARMKSEIKEEILLKEEHQSETLQKIDFDTKESVFELLDTIEDSEHPKILCRLCGESTDNPIHLYTDDSESNEYSLAEKINLSLPITVAVTDPLPKQICQDCRVKLNTCHDLALLSLQTEDKLTLLLRENKLCGTTERQCPLCLEGDMKYVKKSGIYRKDALTNCTDLLNNSRRITKSKTSKKNVVLEEDCNDLSLNNGIDLMLLDNSVSGSRATDSRLKPQTSIGYDLLPVPEGEFSCSICSNTIFDAAEIRTHECLIDDKSSSSCCVICKHTNFDYPNELEVHYRRHGLGEGLFVCEFCCYECEELKDAAEHVKTCRPEFYEIKCETCEKMFLNDESIRNHACHKSAFESHDSEENSKAPKQMKIRPKKSPKHKESNRYNCFFCQKKFTRKGSLQKHLSGTHADAMNNGILFKCYKCKRCNEAFVRESEAETHVAVRHLNQLIATDINSTELDLPTEELSVASVYACEFCERCFTIPSSLHDHRDAEHEKNLEYSCIVCNAIFDSHKQLANHKTVQSHHKPLDDLEIRQYYVCKYCNKTFLHYSSLSSHVLQHQELMPYLCRLCNMSFASYREVAVHRDTVHPYQTTLHERSSHLYQCQYCQKQFSHELELIKHIRMHTGERPYKCSICSKGFSQTSGLYTHLKIHSDLRPYSCPKCPRTFKIKGDRDNHVKKHSGNRPYKCEFCSKAFMTQHVYSQHRRIHTNERPYKCDICGEAFRRSHVLTVHMRRHTGEKPHVCDMCPKTYRQRGDLVKHRKIQHGISSTTSSILVFPNTHFDNSNDSFNKPENKVVSNSSGGTSLLLPI